jgi:hypothetical protein
MAPIHYLYKIKNKLNEKIYIGIHSTEDINDGYMGSGTLGLSRAMKNGKCSTATREFQLLRNKKSLTEESIKKSKETYAKNKHQQGENHSLYGKKTVNDGIECKWIQKEEVEKYLESGWKLGKVKSVKEI